MDGGNFSTEVYTLRRTTSDKEKIYHLATFKYPTIRSAYVTEISWEDDATFRSPRDGPVPGWSTRNAPPPPFMRSDTPLVMVYRTVQNFQFLHCIPTSVFTSVAGRLTSLDVTDEPLVLEWKSWGPENTRCFLDMNPRPFHCPPANFGHQVLQRDLSLLDFNQLDITRDLHRLKMSALSDSSHAHALSAPIGDLEDVDIPGTDTRIIRSPTVIPRGEIFDDDVVTTLPYKRTQIDWDSSFPTPSFVYGGETWVAASQDRASVCILYVLCVFLADILLY